MIQARAKHGPWMSSYFLRNGSQLGVAYMRAIVDTNRVVVEVLHAKDPGDAAIEPREDSYTVKVATDYQKCIELQRISGPDSEDASQENEYESRKQAWHAMAGPEEPSWARNLAWMTAPTGNLSEEMIETSSEGSGEDE